MSITAITHQRLTWVNIVNPTQEDVAYLRKHYNFHPLDLEDVLSQNERPKIDEYDDYLFIVMHFPVFDPQRQLTRSCEVDFFIGAGYLITIHDGQLKPLNRLFEACHDDGVARAKHMGRGAGRLLYSILDSMVDYNFAILRKVDAKIKAIEENMFTEDMRTIVQSISLIRRDIIALRRVVKPQIAIVSNLERKDRPFIQEELDVYFGDIVDGFSRAWDILEDYREVIEGLSATSDSVTSYRINDVIRVLTVISVIMLPLTVITGVYGMNLEWLPAADTIYGFFIVVGFMVLVAGGMLLYFRLRGFI
ncbi:MAG: magnesium/cobalt transporter CorA [Caldilineales bacterium]|nr:magnesium/cobalt transporter CorA [Caldilineales bacterium]MDW8317773.1 magnesium/cobalt transporter CorA [Anaerolineae bacterium]